MNRRLLGAKKVSLLHSFSRATEFLSIMFSLVSCEVKDCGDDFSMNGIPLVMRVVGSIRLSHEELGLPLSGDGMLSSEVVEKC
ncbi:hypothetical protein KY289_037390 [Solanum tuberosum]|nr:hypothetical protein KY289_037390 [Solanum tuberosum]